MVRAVMLCALLVGCEDDVTTTDADGDGFVAADDCDDSDSAVYPGSHYPETPGDGVDQDCDGEDRCFDLNCDGWPDLVVAQAADADGVAVSTSTVWFGGEDGFSQLDSMTLPTRGARAVHVEDIDGDGFIDIILASATDGGRPDVDSGVFWGSIDGPDASKVHHLPTQGAMGIATGDIDQDGYIDVIFANHTDGEGSGLDPIETSSYVYWADADGLNYQNRTALPTTGATDVAVGDFNGDRYTDLAFSFGTPLSGSSTVYLGTADGFTATDTQSLTASDARAVVSGDLNDDGVDDLIIATRCPGAECPLVLATGGDDGLTPIPHDLTAAGASDLALVDVDADGYLDLVLAHEYNGTLNPDADSLVWWGGADGLTAGRATPLATLGAQSVAVGDVDADGIADIVFAQWTTDEGSVRIYNGTDLTTYTDLSIVAPTGVAIAGR